ncbi:membrane-bound alkaline phosphatase-like [Musca domestica]|uniref:Alkaline phosphatase n=1 Tax=Musca domestica TaxID=7370 RepID=A0ABM3V4Q7_MUSDO|nr:membrane-bound alkaline phosphatase-like [Musca domestica]
MYKILASFIIIVLIIWLLLHNGGGTQKTHSESKPEIFNPRKIFNENRFTPKVEKHAEYWHSIGQMELLKNLQRKELNLNRAKNVILFLGDGMSVSTLTAARILKGQRKNQTGEEESLSFENFPYVALSKTYCANSQVADSACTATAYLCGVKGNIGTIGVNGHVEFGNCTASMDPANQVSSILAWAQKAGKATGFITTTSLTHASPAGTYAHVASRLWESDSDIIKYSNGKIDTSTCPDMAQQLISQEPGRNFDIIMGGGMGKFIPRTTKDFHDNGGERKDNRNLLSLWQTMHPQGVLVTNRQQLFKANTSEISHIMGIFQSETMQYHALADEAQQPTLMEMTKVALDFLRRKNREYFIFIEGGKIDSAHHSTKAGLALDETLEFEKAIQLARDMTDPKDTLIVVTADHGQPLTIGGYPRRGSPILGLNENERASDGLKFSTLNYPMGPQQYRDEKTGKRLDLGKLSWKIDSPYPSYIPSFYSSHSGEDVGVYASGPHDYLFTGVLQQNTIPHLIAYAACLGEGLTLCNENGEGKNISN